MSKTTASTASRNDLPRPSSRTAKHGRAIRTTTDFQNFMSGLMSEVVAGVVSTQKVNAACNAGGKLLKAVEMEYRYGKGQKRTRVRLAGRA